jgi:hypothetical protein
MAALREPQKHKADGEDAAAMQKRQLWVAQDTCSMTCDRAGCPLRTRIRLGHDRPFFLLDHTG